MALPNESDRTKLSMIGDSLVASHNLVESLNNSLPGVTVTNRGWNGEAIDGLTMRIGATRVHWTVQGGIIPAEGDVPLTTQQAFSPATGNTHYTGVLAGIEGRILKTGDCYSFRRTQPGAALRVNSPVRLDPTWVAGIRTQMVGILAGRNDINLGACQPEGTVPAHIVAGTRRLVEFLTPESPLFFLLGTINRTTEPAGCAEHQAVVETNRQLAALYPGQYIDLRGYLVNQVIHDLGINPTPDDLCAMAADTPPPSVMADPTHYTDAAAQKIAECLIVPWLVRAGYVA